MYAATRVENNARPISVQLAPSGQPTRYLRPPAKPKRARASEPMPVSQRLRRVPDKNSVYLLLPVLEIDQGMAVFRNVFRSIFTLVCSIFATLRNTPLMLRQREMLAFADRAGGSQGDSLWQAAPNLRGTSANFSAAKSQGFSFGENSGLRFAQIREAALSQNAPTNERDRAAVSHIAQQFRMMRHALALSRRDAALRLGCTEEQILVLENGYGNLANSSEMLSRLERLMEQTL